MSDGEAKLKEETPLSKLFANLVPNFRELLIAVGVDEGTHATKGSAMKNYQRDDGSIVTESEAEGVSDFQEMQVINELIERKVSEKIEN